MSLGASSEVLLLLEAGELLAATQLSTAAGLEDRPLARRLTTSIEACATATTDH